MPTSRRARPSSRSTAGGTGGHTGEAATTLAFPPHVLREYALVADGERGAVFGPRGDIAWLCAPGWADGAVLSGLLGGPGTYAISPPGRHVWGGHYEEGSLVWRNRWVATDEVFECREALALPADPRRLVLLRRLEAVDGQAVVDVALALVADDGASRSTAVRREESGCWTGRAGSLRWRWSGAPDAELDDSGVLRARVEVPSGSSHDFVLEISADELSDEPVHAPAAWATTEAGWRGAVPALDGSVARRDARHAVAVMCGLTAAGGGMVAAATTSLPEHATAGGAFDYRYVWLRDAAYAVQALDAADSWDLADRHVRFLVERVLADGDGLRPAYTATGGTVPPERALDLPGYPGGRAVTGNRAGGQRQLDLVGQVLHVLVLAAARDRLDADGWKAARIARDIIERRWREPESGVWELEPAWWTQSRLTCVAALRALARVGAASEAGSHLALAEAVMAETSARCVGAGGHWQRSPDHAGTDASLVMAAVRGAVPVDDPRTVATVREVQRSLVAEGYVYRFAHDHLPLGQAEGAFLLCGFELSMALHQQGELVDAFRHFERNRAAAGAPGLLAEEFDVEQRQLRGNLPQAFVHARLLEAAVRLGR